MISFWQVRTWVEWHSKTESIEESLISRRFIKMWAVLKKIIQEQCRTPGLLETIEGGGVSTCRPRGEQEQNGPWAQSWQLAIGVGQLPGALTFGRTFSHRPPKTTWKRESQGNKALLPFLFLLSDLLCQHLIGSTQLEAVDKGALLIAFHTRPCSDTEQDEEGDTEDVGRGRQKIFTIMIQYIESQPKVRFF